MPWFGSKQRDDDEEKEPKRSGARPKGEDTSTRWDHPYFNRGGAKQDALDYIDNQGGEAWRNELRSYLKEQGYSDKNIDQALYEIVSNGDAEKTMMGRKLSLSDKPNDGEDEIDYENGDF